MELENHNNTHTAWIMGEGNLIVFARGRSDPSMPMASAVTGLIFGINMEFGEERYRLLRRRIMTDGQPSLWDQNLIKVCAKRVSTGGEFNENLLATDFRLIDVSRNVLSDQASERVPELIGEQMTASGALELVDKLANAENVIYSETKTHSRPRAVAAALVTFDGRLLGAAVNTNHTCQPRHAEVNLFLNLINRDIREIPAGSTLYTSLKPCRMCASLILALTPAPDLKVIASCDDPGTFGRHNLLDGILTIV